MQAVIYHGPNDVRVESTDDPTIQAPTDAIVRITQVALCGSDLHIYHGQMPQTPGQVVGHEYVGVIEEVGEGVTGFKSGDRVVGSFSISCGTCRNCRRRLFHQCRRGGVLGYGPMMGDLPGVQADYGHIKWADVNLRKIPEGVDEKQALFCGDNLATVYGGLCNVNFQPGDSVAVIGCGPIGLQTILTARALGAGRVVALDLVESRLELARRFGAETVHAGDNDPVAACKELTRKAGFDVVVEAVGGSKTLGVAFQIVGQGGRISALGVSNEPTVTFPLLRALTYDLTFRTGLANIQRDIDAVLDLVASGVLQPAQVLSHELPLADAVEAYRMFDAQEATKIFLQPGG